MLNEWYCIKTSESKVSGRQILVTVEGVTEGDVITIHSVPITSPVLKPLTAVSVTTVYVPPEGRHFPCQIDESAGQLRRS